MDSGLFILNILGNICKCPIHSIHYLQYLFCPSLQVKHIYACNKHFDDTQYNQTQLRMHAMGLRSKPPQLLPDAVPHIFSPGPSPSTRHQASYSRKMVGNVCCIINLIYPCVLQSIDNCAYCWCWWCEYCIKDNHIQTLLISIAEILCGRNGLWNLFHKTFCSKKMFSFIQEKTMMAIGCLRVMCTTSSSSAIHLNSPFCWCAFCMQKGVEHIWRWEVF